MGKTYAVKGVSIPRNYQPKIGDKVYIEGKRTGIKGVIAAEPGIRPEYVWFTRAIDGTVAMSTDNLRQCARLEESNG